MEGANNAQALSAPVRRVGAATARRGRHGARCREPGSRGGHRHRRHGRPAGHGSAEPGASRQQLHLQSIGAGTRCASDTTEVLDPAASGIICGSGADMFELMDQATRRVKAERWYDRDGNLVKRVRDNIFSDATPQQPGHGRVRRVRPARHRHEPSLRSRATSSTITTYSTESLVVRGPGLRCSSSSTPASVRLCDRTVRSSSRHRTARPRRLLRRGHLGRRLALRRTGRLIDQVRRR